MIAWRLCRHIYRYAYCRSGIGPTAWRLNRTGRAVEIEKRLLVLSGSRENRRVASKIYLYDASLGGV